MLSSYLVNKQDRGYPGEHKARITLLSKSPDPVSPRLPPQLSPCSEEHGCSIWRSLTQELYASPPTPDCLRATFSRTSATNALRPQSKEERDTQVHSAVPDRCHSLADIATREVDRLGATTLLSRNKASPGTLRSQRERTTDRKTEERCEGMEVSGGES